MEVKKSNIKKDMMIARWGCPNKIGIENLLSKF